MFLLPDEVAVRCFFLPSSDVPVHVSIPSGLRSFESDCERMVLCRGSSCAGSGEAELCAKDK